MPSPSTQLEPALHTTGAVLIPVKAFGQAKGRLSEALDQPTRAMLAQRMATHLVEVQRNVTVAVCCDDPGVAAWAASVGASTIWCPGTGLNGAVQQGVAELRKAGYASVAIAHSDLPLATSLDRLLGWSGVTLVPDRHRAGSNVITIPTSIDFRFDYGTGSFQRHVAEAVRHRRGLRIVHDAQLGWDVDHPDDLAVPEPSFLTEILQSRPTS
ncbi:MAG: 2-phospho-L-lactate guanylyltransferase [Paracrocinitomix sp.]|jgi:2-phospho-L-lactate guanylyltransferase